MAKAGNDKAMLDSCLMQVKLLTIATAPVLILVLFAIPSINSILFHDKWTMAISIVPLLFMRMIPGLATTPIGSMLMINKGGQNFAKANMLWTIIELLGAILFSLFIGPTGLAWSYATFVWVGLLIFVFYLVNFRDILYLIHRIFTALLLRPSIVIAGVLSFLFYLYNQLVGINFIRQPLLMLIFLPILLISYLSEKEVRSILKLNF
jgi:O-antigen/teichoic acid export membrane protein